MMKPFLSMVRANLKMTLRNRTGLFWLLLFPAAFIVIFGSLVGGGNNLHASVGVANGEATPIAGQMTSAMKDSKFFEVQSGTRSTELAKLREGKVDAVVAFPQKANAGQPLRVNSYVDKSDPSTSQAVSAAIDQIGQRVNERAARGPAKPQLVSVSTRGVQSGHLSYIDFLVPGILAMSIMQSSIGGIANSFVVLRERGVLRRIRVMPFPLASFIAARIASQFVVALCQAAILLGLAALFFHVEVVGSLLSVAVFVLFGCLAFLTIGFLVAGVSGKQESASALAQLISFPMLFFSGIFFPLDQASTWLQELAKVLPLTYLADGLRQVMVYGASFMSLWGDVLALAVSVVIGFVLATRFFRWEPKAN
jgi:ABC-2 type transport system permease protein